MTMKSMTCDMCEHTVTAENFGDWMQQMKGHYAEAHADVMQDKAGLSDEDKQTEMQNWMAQAQARFESAQDQA